MAKKKSVKSAQSTKSKKPAKAAKPGSLKPKNRDEWREIQAVIRACLGNLTKAAVKLKVSGRTLRRWVEGSEIQEKARTLRTQNGIQGPRG